MLFEIQKLQKDTNINFKHKSATSSLRKEATATGPNLNLNQCCSSPNLQASCISRQSTSIDMKVLGTWFENLNQYALKWKLPTNIQLKSIIYYLLR